MEAAAVKPHWHVLATRVQAEHPHWPWVKCCAEVAKRRAKPVVKPDPVGALERRRLW